MKTGQMGWGIPGETIAKAHDEEKRSYDALADVVPQRLMRMASKPVLNTDLLERVAERMQEAGFESGFCFDFLFFEIMGKPRDWVPQPIGSCVASGDQATTVDRMMAEVFLLNDPESLPGTEMAGRDNLAFFTPFSYRAGRSIAGINGSRERDDGSLCLPHIQGKMRYGHLMCEDEGLQSDAFPEPTSHANYRQWGGDDRLMNQFMDQATCKLIESEKVTSVIDSTELLTEHYKPQNICSSWAFKTTGRVIGQDAAGRGIYQWTRDRRNQWPHNMQVIGSLVTNGRRYTIIGNQWGKMHDGNTIFAVEENEMDSWLRESQTQSLGEFDLHDNAPAWPE